MDGLAVTPEEYMGEKCNASLNSGKYTDQCRDAWGERTAYSTATNDRLSPALP